MVGLEEHDREREKNFSLWEWKHGWKHGGVKSHDTLLLNQQKLEEHDKKFNDMNDNIAMINEWTTANSMKIQLQDA